jgi:hypothetical protein
VRPFLALAGLAIRERNNNRSRLPRSHAVRTRTTSHPLATTTRQPKVWTCQARQVRRQGWILPEVPTSLGLPPSSRDPPKVRRRDPPRRHPARLYHGLGPVPSDLLHDVGNRVHAIQSNEPAKAEHRLEPLACVDDDLSYSWEPRDREPEQADADKALEPYSGGAIKPAEAETPAPPSNMPFEKPVGATDVFMDDFIQVGQEGPKRMRKLRRHLLEAVDQVLAQPCNESYRNEAISLKKLQTGDGGWTNRKVVLGWVLDTIRQTMELPPHRKLLLANIFQDLQGQKRISQKTWERYLGQLRR